MPELVVRPGNFISGGSSRPGLVVLRPGYVAFLPTAAPTHLVSGLATTMLGLDAVSGAPTHHDLEGWLSSGDEAFDARVRHQAAQGGFVWHPIDAELLVKPGRTGVGVRWLKSSLDILSTEVPGSTPTSLIAPWSLYRRRPMNERDLRRTFRVAMGVTVVLSFPATLVGYLTIVEHNPWGWLAVAFFLALPALLIGGWLHARREVAYELPPAVPALSVWPAPTEDAAPALAFAPQRRLTFPLVTRGLLGGLVDFFAVVLLLALINESVGLPLPGLVLPVTLFAEQLLAVRLFGGLAGQRVLGVRVVAAGGGQPSWRQAALWVLGSWGLMMLLAVGSIFAFVGLALYGRKHDLLPHERWSDTRLEWSR